MTDVVGESSSWAGRPRRRRRCTTRRGRHDHVPCRTRSTSWRSRRSTRPSDANRITELYEDPRLSTPPSTPTRSTRPTPTPSPMSFGGYPTSTMSNPVLDAQQRLTSVIRTSPTTRTTRTRTRSETINLYTSYSPVPCWLVLSPDSFTSDATESAKFAGAAGRATAAIAKAQERREHPAPPQLRSTSRVELFRRRRLNRHWFMDAGRTAGYDQVWPVVHGPCGVRA